MTSCSFGFRTDEGVPPLTIPHPPAVGTPFLAMRVLIRSLREITTGRVFKAVREKRPCDLTRVFSMLREANEVIGARQYYRYGEALRPDGFSKQFAETIRAI